MQSQRQSTDASLSQQSVVVPNPNQDSLLAAHWPAINRSLAASTSCAMLVRSGTPGLARSSVHTPRVAWIGATKSSPGAGIIRSD